MKTQQFIELLEQPEKVAHVDLETLRGLAHKYSYSQVLQLLYANRLKYSSQHLFDRQLGKTALLTNDRSVLFELFEDPSAVATVDPPEAGMRGPSGNEHVAQSQESEARQSPTEAAADSDISERAIPESPTHSPQEEQAPAPLEDTGESPDEKTFAAEADLPEPKREKAPDEESARESPAEEIASNTFAERPSSEAMEESQEPEEEPLLEDAAESDQKPAPPAETKADAPAEDTPMSARIREILERSRSLRGQMEKRREAAPPKSTREDMPSQSAQEKVDREEVPDETRTENAEPPQDQLKEEHPPISEPSPGTEVKEGSAEDSPGLEERAMVDEKDRGETAITTSDLVEAEGETPLPEDAKPHEEDAGERGDQEKPEPTISAIEQRIARIRGRLSKLHESVQDDDAMGEMEEAAYLQEKLKKETGITTNDEVSEEKSSSDAEQKPEGSTAEYDQLENELEDEFLEIEALVAQHRKEHASPLIDDVEDTAPQAENRKEAFEKDEATASTSQEDESREGPSENEHSAQGMSSEEAQRFSFSRWMRQLDKPQSKAYQAPSESDEEKGSTATSSSKDAGRKENEEGLDFEDKIQLLDSFVDKLPDLKKRKPGKGAPPRPANEQPAQPEEMEQESLVTETLAKVYIRQKHYKKAIQAYEILRLKYPAKSSFFASRIEEVKKLINSK